MNPEYVQEVWHVDANGEIFETNFAEMTSWIDQGTLMRGDKVRKGHLRWIEAGKVPSLIAVFNAKDNGQPIAPIITTTKLEPSRLAAPTRVEVSVAQPAQPAMPADEKSCSMHPGIEAFYVCGSCTSLFCKACPNSYGGTVKICPYCGAMCYPL